jgi:peptidyl-prolyl cis-trans isomerase C
LPNLAACSLGNLPRDGYVSRAISFWPQWPGICRPSFVFGGRPAHQDQPRPRGAPKPRGNDVFHAVLKRAPLVALVGLLAASPAFAGGKVLAKVNGADITEDDVKLAQSELGPNLGNVPAEQRTAVLVEYITENRLMSAAADKDGLGADPTLAARAEYYKGRALKDLYFEKKIQGAVSDADAKAIYDKQVAAMKPVEEVRASHILVEKKEDADDIEAKLKAGGDFAAIAKDKSKDTGSGANGGDLGYFAKGQMVKPFEDAAWAMKVGDVSEPVQSQFGWHIIKLIDKRNRPAPAFDGVKDRILSGLLQQKAEEVISSLRKDAKIEYLDEALKKAVEAGQQQQ